MRVVGLADSNLLVADDPKSPLNRRISIIVLNKLAEERLKQAHGEIEAGSADEVESRMVPHEADAANASSATPAR